MAPLVQAAPLVSERGSDPTDGSVVAEFIANLLRQRADLRCADSGSVGDCRLFNLEGMYLLAHHSLIAELLLRPVVGADFRYTQRHKD